MATLQPRPYVDPALGPLAIENTPDHAPPPPHLQHGLIPPPPVGPSYYSPNAMMNAPHPYHTDCPNSLECLPDTDQKPNHILPVIVRAAILGSPKQKLTIREIYRAIENKFPYFRGTEVNWKDSIRHNLSLNKLFEKVPRPLTDPGIGSYWTVNIAARGAKRPRKRKSRGGGGSGGSAQGETAADAPPPPPSSHFDPSVAFASHPVQQPPHVPPFMSSTRPDITPMYPQAPIPVPDGPPLDPSLQSATAPPPTAPTSDPNATIAHLHQELAQAKQQCTLLTQQLGQVREEAQREREAHAAELRRRLELEHLLDEMRDKGLEVRSGGSDGMPWVE